MATTPFLHSIDPDDDAAQTTRAVGAARHLVLVLGDQLDPNSSAFDGFDPNLDVVWMAEVADEATYVWSSRVRIAFFLSAMRHFAAECRARGWRIDYTPLQAGIASLADALRAAIARRRPQRLIVVELGEWRVLQALQAEARAGLRRCG